MVTVMLGIAQVILLIALAPFFSGLGRVITAKLHSRQGPSVLQDYYDIRKLFARQDIYPAEAGFIFKNAPMIMMAAMVTLIMGIPMIARISPIPMLGDIITIIYLLALPRFFFSLTSIDSGSPLAGVGGIRELVVGTLIEPAMMLSLVVLALICKTTSLDVVAQHIYAGSITSVMAVIMAALSFAFAVYVELGKLPFDLAEAEQELQEGPLTEYSGPSLALIKISMSLKQLILLSWFITLFIPFGAAVSLDPLALIVGLVVFLFKLVLCFVVVGLIANTVSRVRYKLFARQSWIAVGIAALAFVFYVVGI